MQVLKVINGRVRSGRNGNWRGRKQSFAPSPQRVPWPHLRLSGHLSLPPLPLCKLPFKLILGLSALPPVYEWLWLGPVLTLDSTSCGFSVWHSLLWLCLSASQLQGPRGNVRVDGLHPPLPGTEGQKKVVGRVGCPGMKM